MEGVNLLDGGDGDSAAKEANHAEDGKPTASGVNQTIDAIEAAKSTLDAAEHSHADNAKRFKMTENVTGLLDAIGRVIDSKSAATNVSDSSSYCEASTSSCDNSTTDKDLKRTTSKSNTTPMNSAVNIQDGSSLSTCGALDSDDDPDPLIFVQPNEIPLEEITHILPKKLSAADNWLGQEVHTAMLNDNGDDDDDDVDSQISAPVSENGTESDADEVSFDRMTVRVVDSDSGNDEKPLVLQKPKPKHNWFIIPEIQNRQFGTSANRQSSDQFQNRCYGSLHCVERLELMYKMEKHSGCVNSINFHPNGKLLVSGSDDLDIVVWDWKLGNPLLSFESKHKSNIFQSKFLPLNGSDLHIVSCARDGQVRLAQLADDGFRSSRKLGSHKGPTHKLTVLNDKPQVVISVGEDGLVLRHDLRNPKSEKVHMVRRDYLDVVPLYSISSNPLNSNEYCVAGRDYRVRTFDLRKGTEELALYHPFNTIGETQKQLHVTCAVYNHNGSEILASYNDEDIYLIDVGAKSGTYVHKYQGHRNGATIKGVNFFGPKSEFVISGSDCGYVYFWEKDSEAIVQWFRADDNGVVNCLEPHPQLPFLCTSGLDSDIKVWVPSYEEDPKLTDLARIVKMNLEERSNWSPASSSEVDNARILWMLWRQFNTSEFIRSGFNLSAGADDAGIVFSSAASDSSSSDYASSASENDNDSLVDEGPGGCATS